MTAQITIIGLGQIGASIGLALGKGPDALARVGHDPNMEAARTAEKMGAVDRISLNLPAAVEKANFVLLALPQDEIRPTMEVIAQDLRPGTVVMDTAPAKAQVIALMAELLPPNCYYIGLLPVIGPAYLHSFEQGTRSANADLFHRSLVGIVAQPGTSGPVIQAAADIVDLLGADKMFMELAEADSLMAALDTLPQLMSAALLSITVARGGWNEGKKLAGRPFALSTVTHGEQDNSYALAQAAIDSKEHTLRLLQSLIETLQEYAGHVAADEQEKLQEKLGNAEKGYQRWREERNLGNWMAEELAPASQIPSSTEWLGRLFGFNPRYQKRK